MGWVESGPFDDGPESELHPSDPRWAYQTRVRRHIEHRLEGTFSDPGEVQQDVAVRLWRVRRWDDKDNPQGYAWTITDNVINDELRRVRARRARTAEVDLEGLVMGQSTEDTATAKSVLDQMLSSTRGTDWPKYLDAVAEIGAWTHEPELAAAAVRRFLPLLLKDIAHRVAYLADDSTDIGAVRSDVERTLTAAVRDALPPSHELNLPDRATTAASEFKRLENRAQAGLRRKAWPAVAHLSRVIIDNRVAPDWPVGRAGAWWAAYVAMTFVRVDRPRCEPWISQCEAEMSRLEIPMPPPRESRGRSRRT